MPQPLSLGIGGAIFLFRSPQDRNLYVEIIEETTGIKPAELVDNLEMQGAAYLPAKMQTLLTSATAGVLKKLHFPTAILPVVVKNPAAAAQTASKIYREHSMTAIVYDGGDLPLDLPRGYIFFVLPSDVDASPLPPIVFWPAALTDEQLAQLTRPEPWID